MVHNLDTLANQDSSRCLNTLSARVAGKNGACLVRSTKVKTNILATKHNFSFIIRLNPLTISIHFCQYLMCSFFHFSLNGNIRN